MKKFLSTAFIISLLFSPSSVQAKCFKKKVPSSSNKCVVSKVSGNVFNMQEKLDFVNICWWENFSDPYLKEYILLAIKNNHDLLKTSWKVEEYRQNVKLSFGRELPSLSVGGNYLLAHWPESIKGVSNNVFAVPFIASYEADIFLKNRDKTRSIEKSFVAAKYDEKGIYISLVSDVATTYINVIKFDKQIGLQEKLIEIKKEKFRRDCKKLSRGTVSASTINNSKKDLETAQSALDEFVKSRDKALTQLAFLIGESADSACGLKRGSFDNFEYIKQMPQAIDSDAIFSRPDVLSAEAQLEKADIDIRVARKEFLPTFSINGFYSMTNIGTGGFGSWQSTLAGLLAGATLDLFKGGTKVANLKINKAKYEQMFDNYRQTDLKAIKEVNDSLIIINQDTKIDQNTIESLNLQSNNFYRSEKRLKQGVISYPNLLTEEETLIQTQQNQINTKANRIMGYLTLYKAVGGKL